LPIAVLFLTIFCQAGSRAHFGATLIHDNSLGRKKTQIDPMKISDLTCSSCSSVYEVAESSSLIGRPGRADCAICGQLLESWQDGKLKAFRLVLPPEHKYRPVTVPPSPIRAMAV
jgi:hypothetical protein